MYFRVLAFEQIYIIQISLYFKIQLTRSKRINVKRCVEADYDYFGKESLSEIFYSENFDLFAP